MKPENERREATALAVERLKARYPGAVCSLRADTPFELLVATRLSAQCTDERVNLVTPALFERYKTIEDFANADVAEVEEYIHSCGFFRQKARDIVGMANMLLSEYDGVLPDTVEELTRLPGVGRKTANLIVGDVYKKPAIVCDTHFIRITNRLGLADTRDPQRVEVLLRDVLDPDESNDFCHRCVMFGREVCRARSPVCSECELDDICEYVKINGSEN